MLPNVPFDRQPAYDCGGHYATQLPLPEVERKNEEEKAE